MIKILFVFGTRPEAIKLAPLVEKLKCLPQQYKVKVCLTSQHREMLDQVLSHFEIKPDIDLNIMKEDQSLFDVTASELKKLETVLKQENPDVVIVQGDTNTTFTASLASYYCQTRIGHVEAGLRTYDKSNPFPEEIYRRMVDSIADYCFAPTVRAKQNLLKEGVEEEKIMVTGNTVIDALFLTLKKHKQKNIHQKMKQTFCEDYGVNVDKEKILLVTVHRRESFGQDMENICQGIKDVALTYPGVQVVWPVHPNPQVVQSVNKVRNVKNIKIIKPLDYNSLVWFMNRCYLILTDSGGIQEEAPSLGKPVLVLRRVTERPEGIEAGVTKLVGVERRKILSDVSLLLDDKNEYHKMAKATSPYGDGKASERIVSFLSQKLK